MNTLHQFNGGQKVNTRCCSYACQQGRTCPAHQACELPEPDEDADGNRALLVAAAIFGAIAAAALLWPVVSYFFIK